MDIIKLEQFQKDFTTAIEKSSHQKLDIETKIKEILDFINTIPNQKAFRKPIRPEFETIRTSQIFKMPPCDRRLLSDAFYSIKETGTYDLSKTVNDTELTYQYRTNTVIQAFELFEYYKWLSNYNINPKKEEEFNVGLRLLSLEYLGIDLLSNDKTKTARTLAPIIGMHQQTIRTSLTYLHTKKNEIRTIENLLKLQEFFKKQGHTSIVIKIQKDIEAIK
jgi:hypothetical protein